MRIRAGRLMLTLCALAMLAGKAHAGLIEDIDLLQITPFFGGQVVKPLGRMPQAMGDAVFASGTTIGGTAGLRFGAISLGILAQRTAPSGIATRELGVDRIY